MTKTIDSRGLSAGFDEPRALSYFVSVEDFFTQGDGTWTEDLNNNIDAYRKVALVRSCINLLAHFSTQKGFRTIVEPHNDGVKKYIDDVNARVNLDNVIYLSIIRREIDGRAGHEIVTDGNKNVTSLLMLIGSRLAPVIDPKTFEIEKFKYAGADGGEYNVEELLYFTLNAITNRQLGLSAIEAIRTVLKLKRNLEKDLLEASKRLWAPFGMFKIDTSMIVDPVKKTEAITSFKNTIKPGQSIVHNQGVEGKVYDMKPDINGLVRAIEKADEEIMGNWGIPKALLAREKTLTKSTLEFSLKALWMGPVAGIQRYYRRELEKQWYPRILEMKNPAWAKTYKVKHIFNPIAVFDPQLILSLARAAAEGLIEVEDFYSILGWEPDQVELRPDKEKIEPTEEEELNGGV